MNEPKANELKKRFLVGRMLEFTPIFSVMAAFLLIRNPELAGLFVAKYIALLGFIVWLSARQFRRSEEAVIRERGQRNDITLDYLLGSGASSNVVPMILAALTVGIAYSLLKQDWRWLIITAALCFLLALGLALRWFVYDRWLRSWSTASPTKVESLALDDPKARESR